jgi:hypothetical protein
VSLALIPKKPLKSILEHGADRVAPAEDRNPLTHPC